MQNLPNKSNSFHFVVPFLLLTTTTITTQTIITIRLHLLHENKNEHCNFSHLQHESAEMNLWETLFHLFQLFFYLYLYLVNSRSIYILLSVFWIFVLDLVCFVVQSLSVQNCVWCDSIIHVHHSIPWLFEFVCKPM